MTYKISYYIHCTKIYFNEFLKPFCLYNINNFYNNNNNNNQAVRNTIYPRSSDPFYIVSYCIKWVTTSWTDSNKDTTKVVRAYSHD